MITQFAIASRVYLRDDVGEAVSAVNESDGVYVSE